MASLCMQVEYHPDKNPDDPSTTERNEKEEAEIQFKAVAQACDLPPSPPAFPLCACI